MRILIPLAGALLALAACGGGDSPFDEPPTSTPTLGSTTQAPTPQPSTATPSTCTPTEYAVEDGDTLGAIADTFGVTVDAIAEASNVEDPDVLAIGDLLTIPCPEEEPAEGAADGA